ncbi:hypothetical protein O5559_28665, partial [Escherichia coli]|nr:hypothetical protein [Escherichia coli]
MLPISMPGMSCIWFSGFCSQGDGACFKGRWHWQSATARRVGVYAPQDREPGLTLVSCKLHIRNCSTV